MRSAYQFLLREGSKKWFYSIDCNKFLQFGCFFLKIFVWMISFDVLLWCLGYHIGDLKAFFSESHGRHFFIQYLNSNFIITSKSRECGGVCIQINLQAKQVLKKYHVVVARKLSQILW